MVFRKIQKIPVFFFITYFLYSHIKNATAGHLLRAPHNLSCYTCNSLIDGNSCRSLQLKNAPTQSCKSNQMFCSVILFQYSADSSDFVFYSVQRRCEETCQEGCSTVGERIKLFLCRSCCNGYLCNYGNDAERNSIYNKYCLFLFAFLVLYGYVSFFKSSEVLLFY